MPRDGSGTYTLPAGSTVTNGDTSDASDINAPLADLEADMNTVRPIVAGGTGANTLVAAQSALKIPAYNGTPTISGAWVYTGNQTFNDSVAIRFGTGADTSISHDGTNTIIADASSGLIAKTASFKVQNAAGTEDMIEAVQDSFVKLRHNNTARLTTTSSGVDVTGTCDADNFTLPDGPLGMTLIGTVNITSSTASATIDIPASYGGIIVKYWGFRPVTANTVLTLEVGENGAGGAFVTSSNYINSAAVVTAGTVAGSLSTDASFFVSSLTGTAALGGGTVELMGFNQASTQIVGHHSSMTTNNSSQTISRESGHRIAVAGNYNAIKLICGSGNIALLQARVYGLKLA